MNALLSTLENYVSGDGHHVDPAVDQDDQNKVSSAAMNQVRLHIDHLENATLLSERQEAVEGLVALAPNTKRELGQAGIPILFD